MSAATKIEWCDSTFNPWIGCTRVSPACDDCYAARSTPARALDVEWGTGQPRKRTSAGNWKLPERWNKEVWQQCKACGWRGPEHPTHDFCPSCDEEEFLPARRRVFCASLADWLDNEVPIEWLVDLLYLIWNTQNLDWLLLSKRIGNWQTRLELAQRYAEDEDPRDDQLFATWISEWRRGFAPSNVWIGATVVNQGEIDRDLLKLLLVPSFVRFLSIEPMLGAMNIGLIGTLPGDLFPGYQLVADRLHWVICGGESGPKARPMHADWVRSLRDECEQAGVPFLFKQWGEWEVASVANGHYDSSMTSNAAYWVDHHDGSLHKPSSVGLEHPVAMIRVGKKKSGRLLDGRTWDEFPEAKG